MSASSLESQGCHLIPLSYLLCLFFCPVLWLFLSCHCFAPVKSPVSLGDGLVCMAFAEQLGDDSLLVVWVVGVIWPWCLPHFSFLFSSSLQSFVVVVVVVSFFVIFFFQLVDGMVDGLSMF